MQAGRKGWGESRSKTQARLQSTVPNLNWLSWFHWFWMRTPTKGCSPPPPPSYTLFIIHVPVSRYPNCLRAHAKTKVDRYRSRFWRLWHPTCWLKFATNQIKDHFFFFSNLPFFCLCEFFVVLSLWRKLRGSNKFRLISGPGFAT